MSTGWHVVVRTETGKRVVFRRKPRIAIFVETEHVPLHAKKSTTLMRGDEFYL